MNMPPYSERVSGIDLSGIRKLFDAFASAGPGAIDLGIGQPDFDTPEHIKEAAIDAIRRGKTGYTPGPGIPELRGAISEKLKKENGLDYSPEHILVTAGGSEALHLVMEALVNPGERVLVPDPGFVSYRPLTRIAGGEPVGMPVDASMHTDVEQAKELLDGAKVCILNSPSNPTGMVEPKESIRAIVEYADDCGVWVISDEVYEHFCYDSDFVSAARFGENVITINAASKTYAMTGWRLGFLAAPPEAITACLKVHQYCQACATSISQYAAWEAYAGDQSAVKMMREEYLARRDLLYCGLSGMGLEFPRPEGAFYMFVPFGAEKVSAIISDGILIVPGSSFGSDCGDYARVSYATSRDNLKQAVERIQSIIG